MAKSPKTSSEAPGQQVAALPWRMDADGKLRILMITSRTNAKWMLPKGWPMPDISPAQAALIEAREEAGVEGTVSESPIGSYHYIKLFEDGSTKSFQAMIYPLRVEVEHANWDEKAERCRQWLRPRKAARSAFEPDLSRFLIDLATERVTLF